MARRRMLVAGGLTALLLVSGLGAPSAQADQVVSKRDGWLSPSLLTGTPGTTVRFRGRVAPRTAHTVTLQVRWDGLPFVTVATRTTTRKGTFTFRSRLPDELGKVSYRVLSTTVRDPDTGTRIAYHTPRRTLRVLSPESPPVGQRLSSRAAR